MSISAVTKEDIESLKRIARKAIVVSVIAEDTVKTEIIRDTYNHIDRNHDSNDCIFLKHQCSQTNGFILIQTFWNLSDLFVSPDKHGQGIGTMLLDEAISTCKQVGAKGYVRVNSSTNAAGFYRKHGFVTCTPSRELPDFVIPLEYRF